LGTGKAARLGETFPFILAVLPCRARALAGHATERMGLEKTGTRPARVSLFGTKLLAADSNPSVNSTLTRACCSTLVFLVFVQPAFAAGSPEDPQGLFREATQS